MLRLGIFSLMSFILIDSNNISAYEVSRSIFLTYIFGMQYNFVMNMNCFQSKKAM